MTKKSDDFLEILESGVRDVIRSESASIEQKIQAINAGSKILQIKNKVLPDDDKSGSFFSK